MSGIESALAALYLRGIPRPAEPHVRAWPEVLSILRRHPAGTEFAPALRSAGYSIEAAVLESRAHDQASRLIESGLALTIASQVYPRRWVERLGQSAPPALYARGSVSLLDSKAFGIVGSRCPPGSALKTAVGVAIDAAELGFVAASGGAPGIDRVVPAAAAFIEIWPCGLGLRWGAPNRCGCPFLHLSLWPPREEFSTAGAMERNTLVYALTEATFVGHARFRQGGSWHGATDALRRRLTRVIVSEAKWPGDAEPARRALMALGAQLIHGCGSGSLEAAIAAQPLQPWLPSFAPDPIAERALGAY